MAALKRYRTAFELPFLKETSRFYGVEALRNLEAMSLPDYLSHVHKRIQLEKDRVTQYFSPDTWLPLLAVCQRCFVVDHIQLSWAGDSGR